MIVFPDEGHWVLKALNSQYWHEQVFGWMKRWIEEPREPSRRPPGSGHGGLMNW